MEMVQVKEKNKEVSAVQLSQNGAKLKIETPVVKEPEINIEKAGILKMDNVPQVQTQRPKLNSLSKIRQQIIEQNKEVNTVKELQDEELYIAWGLYIEKLRELNNNSGIANFKSAVLKIIDGNNIEIITESNLQQKFIENERAALLEHLQSHFKNRFLTYKVKVVENENGKKPLEIHLSAKEQYLKMIEEYPLVKELKDRLRLDLDF